MNKVVEVGVGAHAEPWHLNVSHVVSVFKNSMSPEAKDGRPFQLLLSSGQQLAVSERDANRILEAMSSAQ